MRKNIAALLVVVLLFTRVPTATAASAAGPLRVFYAGPQGGVTRALGLIDPLTYTQDLIQADVIVLNGEIPDPAAAAARVREGAGLLLMMGPGITADQLSLLLGAPATLSKRQEPLSLVSSSAGDPAVMQAARDIIWTSSPQVRERFALSGPALQDFRPMVSGYEDGSPILASGTLGKGRVFLMAAFLDGANPQIQDWAYFNYLIYNLAYQAAGRAPLSFADYPGSPVPHASDRNALFALMGGWLCCLLRSSAPYGATAWPTRKNWKRWSATGRSLRCGKPAPIGKILAFTARWEASCWP